MNTLKDAQSEAVGGPDPMSCLKTLRGEITITGMWKPGPPPVPPGHVRVTIGDETWIVPEKIARRLWLRSLRPGHRRYVRRHDPRVRRCYHSRSTNRAGAKHRKRGSRS